VRRAPTEVIAVTRMRIRSTRTAERPADPDTDLNRSESGRNRRDRCAHKQRSATASSDTMGALARGWRNDILRGHKVAIRVAHAPCKRRRLHRECRGLGQACWNIGNPRWRSPRAPADCGLMRDRRVARWACLHKGIGYLTRFSPCVSSSRDEKHSTNLGMWRSRVRASLVP
jgi:hypothetical protein